MLDRIERKAEISVARGCGFAALAIALLFLGASPGGLPFAFKITGNAALMTCAVLLLKAWRAEHRPYHRTEVWSMLHPDERPTADVAQRIIGPILRIAFLRFAQQAAITGAVMLTLSVFGDQMTG